MTDTSVDGPAPPGQLLGEYMPTAVVRLTLLDCGNGEAVLERHRYGSATPPSEIAARIRHAGAVVSAVEWDKWHRRHKPVWMGSVEDWIRHKIAQAAS